VGAIGAKAKRMRDEGGGGMGQRSVYLLLDTSVVDEHVEVRSRGIRREQLQPAIRDPPEKF
jgi:hypothetical protein